MPFKVSFMIWRMWKKIIPIGKVLVKIRMCDELLCKCCAENENDTSEHLFIKFLVANRFSCNL